jgi:plasmid stability protein
MADKQVKDYDKFNLRFPDGMRDAIAERAKANGRSMNSEIIQILEDAINIDKNPDVELDDGSERIIMTKHQLDEITATLKNALLEGIALELKSFSKG